MKIFVALIVVAVLCLAAFFFIEGIAKPKASPEEKARADVQFYFKALAEKDWKNVCSHLTLPAQQQISGPNSTCATKLASSPPALQDRLALAGKESRIVKVDIKGRDGIVTADRQGQQTLSKILLVKDVWVIDVNQTAEAE